MTSGFFALFDDIASLFDDVASMSKDVASMSKVAGKKTAGILGDDLAVNAEKASGFASKRELPVLWAIAKGSMLNKVIILPAIFLLSAFFPQVIVPILIVGGTYLAYEAAEKIFHFFFHQSETKEKLPIDNLNKENILEFEKKKIKSAILVDFILSIEITIIALSSVIDETLTNQIIVVSIISILATVGVYSIVALIVRMDDLGFKLVRIGKTKFTKNLGLFLVKALPIIIKALTIIGTLAMLLVAGGIFMHNVHFFHELLPMLPTIITELIIGLVVGIVIFSFIKLIGLLFSSIKKAK
ncbi:MAG: DUF808 domain-containing protein [Putridiphycobacter sp.]